MLTGQMGKHKLSVWDECRGDETDVWYRWDCVYRHLWVASERVQMLENVSGDFAKG